MTHPWQSVSILLRLFSVFLLMKLPVYCFNRVRSCEHTVIHCQQFVVHTFWVANIMIGLLQCYLWHRVENILICRVLFESFYLFSDKKNENSSRFGVDNDDGFFCISSAFWKFSFHQLSGICIASVNWVSCFFTLGL